MPEGLEAERSSGSSGSPSGVLRLDLPGLKSRWLQSATLLITALLALVIGSHLPPFCEQLTTIAASEVAAATVVHRRRNWGAGEAWYLEITTAGSARHCCGEGASRTDLDFLADRLSGNKLGSTADA